jgi:hypothetical protein
MTQLRSLSTRVDTSHFLLVTNGIHLSLQIHLRHGTSQEEEKKRETPFIERAKDKEGLTYRDSDSEKEVIRLISLLTNTTTVREIERGRESSPEQSRNR